MLKVVSNTTPLLSLLKIDKLDILRALYGEIYIPKGVFDEIEAGKNKGFYRDLSTKIYRDDRRFTEGKTSRTDKKFETFA
jgi:predicted nucleic acid-binding protein